jgi:hypothetical protein
MSNKTYIDTNELREEIDDLTSLNGNERSLMDEVLMHQPKDVQRQVRKLVEMSGIDQDDPYFLILLCCRINQILLQNAPIDLEKSFDNGRSSIVQMFEQYVLKLEQSQSKHLEEHRRAALDISISKLNIAIAKILEDNNIDVKKGKFTPRVLGIITAAITAAISLMVGFGAGWSFDKAILSKKQLVNLTAEQIALLKWAEGKEGTFAKKILDWNEDLVGQECQKNVRDLNVTIQIGSAQATSGYCWIWTVPPDQRDFNS